MPRTLRQQASSRASSSKETLDGPRRSSSRKRGVSSGDDVRETSVDSNSTQRPQRKRQAPNHFEPSREADYPRVKEITDTHVNGKKSKSKATVKAGQDGAKSNKNVGKTSAKDKAAKTGPKKRRISSSQKASSRTLKGGLSTSEVDELASSSAPSDAEMTPDRILSPSDEEWFIAHYKSGYSEASSGENKDDFGVWVEPPAVDELAPLSEIVNKPLESTNETSPKQVNGKKRDVDTQPVGAQPLEKGHAPPEALMKPAPEHFHAIAQKIGPTLAHELDEASPSSPPISIDSSPERRGRGRVDSIEAAASSKSHKDNDSEQRPNTQRSDTTDYGTEKSTENNTLQTTVPPKQSIFRNFEPGLLFRGAESDEDESGKSIANSPAKRAQDQPSQRQASSTALVDSMKASASDTEGAKAKSLAKKKRRLAKKEAKTAKKKAKKAREAKQRADAAQEAEMEMARKKRERKFAKKQKESMKPSSSGASRKRHDKERLEESNASEDDDDDLRQDLNVDAFVKSRSEKEALKQRHQRLKQLRLANKKRARAVKDNLDSDAADDEDASEQSDASSTGSSSADSSSSSAFVVDDEDEEPISHAGSHDKMHLGAKAQPFQRSVVNASMPGVPNARLTLAEKCDEYLKRLLVLALDLEDSVPKDRMRTLERVRTDLRQELRMEYTQLTSQSTRRQFRWYLTHYPYFEKREMTDEEVKMHRGCAACKRASQQCEFAFSFWGRFYNADTLEWRGEDSDTDSDISTDRQDERIAERNAAGEDVHTFFLGGTCAQKAAVMHRLLHWERRALRDLTRLPSFKALRKRARSDGGRGKDSVRPEEIEDVAKAHRGVLLRFIQRLKAGSENARNRNAYVHRGHEKWDDVM